LRTLLLLGLVVSVSLAARLSLLVARPLWHDEIFTVWVARLPAADRTAALAEDSGPPGFYVAARPFVRIAEVFRRDMLVRALPFLAGLALFAAMGSLPAGAARRWGIGLPAAWTLVNLYAAEARAYELVCLAGLVIFLLGLRGSESPGRLAALALVGAAALWLHYLVFLAVGAAIVLALARRRMRSALALGVSVAAVLPWLPLLFSQPAEAMAWLRDPPVPSLLGFLSALGGVGRIPAPFGAPLPEALPLLGLLLGVALVGAVGSVARRDIETRTALALVLLVLALSVAAALWRPIAFAGRSEMAVLGVWIWAVAQAASRSRAVAVLAAAAAAAGLAATVLVATGPHPGPVPVSATRNVARLARPGDAVVAGPGFYLPARLAADRGELAARVVSLPAGDAAHPGWFIAWPLSEDDVRAVEALARGLPEGARLFLLLPPVYSTPALMGPLERHGRLQELVRQPDGILSVWTRGG